MVIIKPMIAGIEVCVVGLMSVDWFVVQGLPRSGLA